jgi:hypothetical protein
MVESIEVDAEGIMRNVSINIVPEGKLPISSEFDPISLVPHTIANIQQCEQLLGNTDCNAIIVEAGTLNQKFAQAIGKLIRQHDRFANIVAGDRDLQGLLQFFQSIYLHKKMVGSGKRIQKLSFNGNKINAILAKEINTIIQEPAFRKPFHLAVSGCQIGDEELKILIKNAKHWDLGSLDLSANPITDQSVAHLKIFLKNTHKGPFTGWRRVKNWFGFSEHIVNLKQLNLANTNITNEGAADLEKVLRNNIDCLALDLSGNGIDSAILDKIAAHLADNKAIATLQKNIQAGVALVWEPLLIKRLTKMTHAGVLVTQKINFNNMILAPEQALALEQWQLENDYTFAIENLKTKEQPAPFLLVKHNEIIGKIMGNRWRDPYVSRSFFWLTTLALAPLILSYVVVAYYAAYVITYPINTLRLAWNTRFEGKLNALRDPERWGNLEKREAHWGNACKNSKLAYLNPLSWTPAAYLAFNAQAEDAIIPENIIRNNSKLAR